MGANVNNFRPNFLYSDFNNFKLSIKAVGKAHAQELKKNYSKIMFFRFKKQKKTFNTYFATL